MKIEVNVGDYVLISNKMKGVVKYIGHTHFTDGEMIGIELKVPAGRHDGCYDGQRYFDAAPKCGVFAPPNKVTLDVDCYLIEYDEFVRDLKDRQESGADISLYESSPEVDEDYMSFAFYKGRSASRLKDTQKYYREDEIFSDEEDTNS